MPSEPEPTAAPEAGAGPEAPVAPDAVTDAAGLAPDAAGLAPDAADAADAPPDAPAEPAAPAKGRKTAQQQAEEKRNAKLDAVREQVEDGGLVIRKMTEEERQKYPPRPTPVRRPGRR